jgi:hypothetical protein
VTAARVARGVVALLTALSVHGFAQDTVPSSRHVLPLDVSRLQPFHRSYDIVIQSPDSTFVIGLREVAMLPSIYAGAPSWLLVETRSGAVPSVESLYVARDMRPIHWSSALGAARLGAQFVGDSIYGATSSPVGRQNIVVRGRPDLLVSSMMVEALLPLLPLTVGWVDSVGVLAVDGGNTSVVPAELIVIGEEDLFVDSLPARSSWVVALRTEPRYVLFWIDKETGATLRVQHALYAARSAVLDYRLRPMAASGALPP